MADKLKLEVAVPERQVLCDEVDSVKALERAETARRRANDMLQSHEMEIDVERASQAIRRAEARLEATRRVQNG